MRSFFSCYYLLLLINNNNYNNYYCYYYYFPAANELHQEFPMIKYARGGRSIPHERVFKLDKDNLVRNKTIRCFGK